MKGRPYNYCPPTARGQAYSLLQQLIEPLCTEPTVSWHFWTALPPPRDDVLGHPQVTFLLMDG